MTDIKSNREQLNEKFFKDMDLVLIERLRSQMQHEEKTKALEEASGIHDQAVLEELVEQNVCPETISAFRLVPLVSVAWSDGSIQPQESEAIMKAAVENGIKPGTAAHDVLQSWLERKPPHDLLTAWKDYTQSLLKTVSPATVQSLRDDAVGRAEAIATAAGGFLGLGSISSSEQAVIDEVRSVFET
ncbi:MAG: hypothetical protein R3C05_19840 [Pirellulaceae bacterium]